MHSRTVKDDANIRCWDFFAIPQQCKLVQETSWDAQQVEGCSAESSGLKCTSVLHEKQGSDCPPAVHKTTQQMV